MVTRYNHIDDLINKKDYDAVDIFMTEHKMNSSFVYARMAVCLTKDIELAKENNFSECELSALTTLKNQYEYDSTHWGIEMPEDVDVEDKDDDCDIECFGLP